MIRIAIVENDDRDMTMLKDALMAYLEKIDFKDCSLSTFANALDFLDDTTHKYDLVFLDILMPHMDGMELAQKIRQTNDKMMIIFTTNLTNFAIKGYEVNAYDYLVKPINVDHLASTMDKAIRILKQHDDSFISLTNKTSVRMVNLRSILSVEISSHLITYHFIDGTTFDVWGTLNEEMKRLPEREYVRVNKFQLINMAHINSIKNGVVYAVDGRYSFAMSRIYKKDATTKILSYFGSRDFVGV